jgi:hypothetical protein
MEYMKHEMDYELFQSEPVFVALKMKLMNQVFKCKPNLPSSRNDSLLVVFLLIVTTQNICRFFIQEFGFSTVIEKT